VPGVYPGKMTICNHEELFILARSIHGWGGIAAGGLEIIELPSDPGGIFLEPTCKHLHRNSRRKSIRPYPAAPKFLIRLKRF